MSKERLEEIKEHTAWTVDNGLQPRIDDYDLAWLINRVEELEKQSHGIELNLLNDEVVRLEKQNQIYKQALEFYADRDNYKLEHFDPNLDDYMSTVDYDEGKTARNALEGEE